MFVYLANALRQLDGTRAMFFATDINPLAASVAQHTATINDVPAFDLVRTDLVSCYEQRLQVVMCVRTMSCDGIKTLTCSVMARDLQGKVDVLLFNPPYVPTPSDEVGSTYVSVCAAVS